MAIYLDSADLEEIKRSAEWPFLAGVTCNPSLISRALKKNKITQAEFFDHLEKIFSLTHGRVFVQTNFWDESSMLNEADRLNSAFQDRLIIKVPFCEEGIKAVHVLKDRGMTVAMTAIFNPLQAYLSAMSGVDFVVPYCNRMGRVGQDGVEMVRQSVVLLMSQASAAQILVASIRTQTQILHLLDAGVNNLTLPFSLIEEIIAHPLSWEAAELFSNDLQVLVPKEKSEKHHKKDEAPPAFDIDFFEA